MELHGTGCDLDTAVVDSYDEDVACADGFELVHDCGDLGFEDHGADSVPVWVFEGGDCGGSSTGGDFERLGEVDFFDVVLAEHIFGGGDDAADACGDELDEVCVGARVGHFAFDEHGLRDEQVGDGGQPTGAHRLAAFDEVDNSIGESERTGSLHRSAHVLDLRLEHLVFS